MVTIVLYVLYLIFFFRHPEGTATGTEEGVSVPFGPRLALLVLLISTAAVAYVWEAVVGPIEPLVEEYGISELFVGVILVLHGR